MMGEYITMKDVIEGYKDRMLLEEKEKVEEKKYISQSLDHNMILISPEINKQIESNKVFETMIETALSEITKTLDEEFHGQIGYMINIGVARDYENPDWKVTEIEIKVPIDNPKYVLRLWDKVSDRAWDKVRMIEENIEEIEKIEDNTMITFDILE